MSDERYYPSYLNEAEHLREQIRQEQMVNSITRSRSSLPSERDDSIRKHFSERDGECRILALLEAFLLREMAEIEREHSMIHFFEMFVKRTMSKDDLFYTFVDIPGQDFEEGSWVEVKTGEFCQFGSLWFSEKNVIIQAPKMKEDDYFLTILKYYYEKKTAEHKVEQTSPLRSMIQRLRAQIKTTETVIVLPPPKPYDRTHEMKPVPQKLIDTKRDKSKIYSPLISTKDFEEYGKVYKYLKEHPHADNREIALKTGLHISRVNERRLLIESQ